MKEVCKKPKKPNCVGLCFWKFLDGVLWYSESSKILRRTAFSRSMLSELRRDQSTGYTKIRFVLLTPRFFMRRMYFLPNNRCVSADLNLTAQRAPEELNLFLEHKFKFQSVFCTVMYLKEYCESPEFQELCCRSCANYITSNWAKTVVSLISSRLDCWVLDCFYFQFNFLWK